MDVALLTLEGLKALAYDQLAIIENAQNNLRIINTEIARRAQMPAEEPAPKPKEGKK
jgi:hypothetical protein